MKDCSVKLDGEEREDENEELLDSNPAHVNMNCWEDCQLKFLPI